MSLPTSPTTVVVMYRESVAVFEELSDIFSNENNQLASRNLLMKVRIQAYMSLQAFNNIRDTGIHTVEGIQSLSKG